MWYSDDNVRLHFSVPIVYALAIECILKKVFIGASDFTCLSLVRRVPSAFADIYPSAEENRMIIFGIKYGQLVRQNIFRIPLNAEQMK